MSVSEKVSKYIESNNLSFLQISKDTGIDERKLRGEIKPLEAGEFLELCFYLNVKPEEFME
ncbi:MULTISPECIES: hypothetical protein [Eubacterium]|uniref:XRE family transcriptional regulator n=1 Tax=Eubacterium segne TaxID=2763045 RepID=A0ABR7F4F6_9FIRM|nr:MULTISPECIES: hypothetical protein [Eubacterium]MBC5668477.1 hypothetical protein [Eubacterium segne]MBS5483400.1 hypothetical protein [Eubacterium sp.]RHR72504.1 hypothetical protein DWW68_05790 [Eubacterium sp. AF16-48]RHR77938.1 hypothetical protein DWW50_10285 [Eubacterium sp. AF15-50]